MLPALLFAIRHGKAGDDPPPKNISKDYAASDSLSSLRTALKRCSIRECI